MVLSPTRLRRELRRAGIANAAIDAVWPQWWSDEAAGSLSATAELTYTVARRLGLSPRSLFDGTTEFMWRDETKFKNLAAQTGQEAAALASFGIAVGQCAIEATGEVSGAIDQLSARALRDAILARQPVVDYLGLLAYCWSVGIPVLQLRVFPLRNKRMHAMTARAGGRYAVLLGKEATYLAPTTYALAHEIGHVVLGHLESDNALLEMADPVKEHEGDTEEIEADRFALALLTGSEEPAVGTNTAEYAARDLAREALAEAPRYGIEPGVLVLCLAHATGAWDKAYAALRWIPPGRVNVGDNVNEIAATQLRWDALSFDNQDYLMGVMGRGRAA
jgi:hypothetical protein